MQNNDRPETYSAPEAAAVPTLLLLSPLRLVRETLSVALATRMGNWQIVSAADPRQATELCQNKPPRVALLDVGPDHSHLHWGANLIEAWQHLPVIVLDNSSNDTLVRLALSLGLAGYVTKEQPLSALQSAIEEAAQGRRVFSPDVASRLRVTAGGLRLVEDQPTPWSKLTARELDVLALIAQGHSVSGAAKVLGISPATVDNHKTRLMQKLGIHKATQLAAWAVSVGLVSSNGLSNRLPSPTLVMEPPTDPTSAPVMLN
ncbi:MAG: response regulator transcription factor [Planctomycetaceae bacterium]|nr:response regulator transcription factor [Planctomycetaceae bacterium]